MDELWSEPAGWVSPGPGAVQVWRFDASPEAAAAWLPALDGPERLRSERMRAGRARDEFVVGRAMLRRLLAGMLGREPEDLRFVSGEHGKPGLEGGAGVEFNVAHSRGRVLVALSRAGAVGIDVEWCNPAVEAVELAEGTFTAAETAEIAAAAARGAEVEVFYRCWTRKEAVLKADGRGITTLLSTFCVCPLGEVWAGRRVALPDGGVFAVRDFGCGAGFRAALAVGGEAAPVGWMEGRNLLMR